MLCTWRTCGVVVILLLALLLSPRMTTPGFLDRLLEDLLDNFFPVEIVKPNFARSPTAPFYEILQPRPPHCPAVYKSCEAAHSFAPRATDVIITTPPKAGTTFLQQMTHQIRTGGDMNFSDIYDVSPWILINPVYRGDAADVVQKWHPRLFKNHQPLSEFRRGRHIVVVRDPATLFQSYYAFCLHKRLPFLRHNSVLHMASSLWGVPESLAEVLFGSTWKDEYEFARSSLGWRRDMGFGVNIFQYIAEFWHVRHDPNILFLCYEDVASNTARWIPVVGKFMGIDMSSGLVDRVVEMTSKHFMLQHISKFDESQIVDEINQKGYVKMQWLSSPRVSQTRHPDVPAYVQDMLHAEWMEQVAVTTGVASYAEMRAKWLEEMASI